MLLDRIVVDVDAVVEDRLDPANGVVDFGLGFGVDGVAFAGVADEDVDDAAVGAGQPVADDGCVPPLESVCWPLAAGRTFGGLAEVRVCALESGVEDCFEGGPVVVATLEDREDVEVEVVSAFTGVEYASTESHVEVEWVEKRLELADDFESFG